VFSLQSLGDVFGGMLILFINHVAGEDCYCRPTESHDSWLTDSSSINLNVSCECGQNELFPYNT